MKSEKLERLLILISALIVTGYGSESRSLSREKKSTGKRLEFRIVMMGEIIDAEATKAGFRTDWFSWAHLGFSDFDASDGERVHAEDGEFRSREEAKRYFDWKVARSAKNLTQGIKTNFKGKPVEYRAEVVLEPDQKQSAVMWTNGATFRQIISKSLADAMGLAKRYGY